MKPKTPDVENTEEMEDDMKRKRITTIMRTHIYALLSTYYPITQLGGWVEFLLVNIRLLLLVLVVVVVSS
jgi:hypothetical protein